MTKMEHVVSNFDKIGNEVNDLVKPLGYKAKWHLDVKNLETVTPTFVFEDNKGTPVLWLEVSSDMLEDEAYGPKFVASMFQDELRKRQLSRNT